MHVADLPVCLVLASVLTACVDGGHEDWEIEACDGEDLELVDHTIAEAALVEPYVEAALAARFGGEFVRYSEILDQLVAVRSKDGIYCGRPPGDPSDDARGFLRLANQEIVINVDSPYWLTTLEDWEEGQAYGTLSATEVEAAIRPMDEAEHRQLRLQAWAYLTGPAHAVELLVHEAAHVATPDCCHHELGVLHDCDFVDSVGKLAAHGVYWERWHSEGLWLDQLYWSTHNE